MATGSLTEALGTLRSELARGEDVYESPALIHEAMREFGGQALLCGDPARVDELLAALPNGTEPEIVFEMFRVGLLYANDGGQSLRKIAAEWADSNNPYKTYIAKHQKELTFE